jgi:UTP--glucose-1-phosphate uridylyltransferase
VVFGTSSEKAFSPFVGCESLIMKLRKAVFPVAGLGTRFLPATKTIPKEMLPIVDRPIIQYAVDEAIEAGCDTLIFVTGRSKRAVEDYFDRSPELEAELEAKGKTEALDLVRNIIPSHVKVLFVRQPQPLGLGHAVLCAAPMIGRDEFFAVMLPDDLIDGHPVGVLRQMVDVAAEHLASVVAVEQVPREATCRYGIVDPESVDGTLMRLKGIVEKPRVEEAPSTSAVVGRYILHSSVLETLETQPPGSGGEIQLTDALAKQIETPGLLGYRFGGKRFDCGSKHGFLVANIHFGMK